MVGPPPDLPEVSPAAPTPTPVAVAEPVASAKSKAALRAKRWRGKQKLNNPNFQEQERLRKEAEREEKDRAVKITAVLAEPEPQLTVVNADGETVRLITGGYGSRRIGEVDDRSEQVEDMDGSRKVVASGSAPAKYDSDAEKERRIKEHANQFVRKAFQCVRTPREVKAMKAFLYSNVEKSKSELTICSHCKIQLTPFPSEVLLLAFCHFHDVHPKLFETMMAKVKKASEKPVCPVNHEAVKSRYAAQSARDGQKLQCGHCHKILWRPGEYLRKRSDKQKQVLKPTNAI